MAEPWLVNPTAVASQGPQFGPGDLAEIGVHLDQQADLNWLIGEETG